MMGLLFGVGLKQRKPESFLIQAFRIVAEWTGLEPATPCVTGRYSNQLNYRSTEFLCHHPDFHPGLLQFDAWQFPTLAWGDPTLPSALRRFTSEFGMGSGGTTALQPPGKFCLLTRLSRLM